MSNEAIQEIEEELQWDRVWNVLHKYRYLLIGGVVSILSAVGGFLWYQNHLQGQREAWSAEYIQAVEWTKSGDFDKALACVEQVQKRVSQEQKALVLLLKARILTEQALKNKKTGDQEVGEVGEVYAQIAQQNPKGFWSQMAQVMELRTSFDRLGDQRSAKIHTISGSQHPFQGLGFEAAVVEAYARKDFAKVQELCTLILQKPQCSDVLKEKAELIQNHTRMRLSSHNQK